MIRQGLLSRGALHYPSFPHGTVPMVPTSWESWDYKVASFSSLRNEFELHGSECLCLECFKKDALKKTLPNQGYAPQRG